METERVADSCGEVCSMDYIDVPASVKDGAVRDWLMDVGRQPETGSTYAG